MTEDAAAVGARQFKCKQCGARLEFAPGERSLVCPYCSTKNEIAASVAKVEELDFDAALEQAKSEADTQEVLTVKCKECAAVSTLPPNVTSAPCPFCGSGLVSTAESRKSVKPGAILPFHVKRDAAQTAFAKWISERWFAPGDLKRLAEIEGKLNGVYVPYWTYDADTTTRYTGQRGDAYYVTQTVTVMVNGKPQMQTRQVRHIRWSPAGGTVENSFDDLLVRATSSLPAEHLDALEPWDTKNLVPYQDEYLSGFRADSYQVDLAAGFGAAKEMMEPRIDSTICSDIGGDEQRIDSKSTQYRDVTFKHLLFPVWIMAYRYRGKVFRILVNARTAEVQGERPWSFAKFLLLALAVVGGIGLIALIASLAKH